MNPYQKLSGKHFWKSAVSSRSMFDIREIWDPKFKITQSDKVSTYGSCFAQYIGNALKSRSYNWVIAENPPNSCTQDLATKYNYNIFSSRTGNIYTASLLKQWIEWSLDYKTIPDEIWEKDGRFFDLFRPRIEPNGFLSVDELKISRNYTLGAFKRTLLESDFLIFTLGLTESWINADEGFEYPLCPGTAVGEYDESKHVFFNQKFVHIEESLRDAFNMIRDVNPRIRFILTVSPVPLIATMSGRHVLPATMASKSILRAVADQICESYDFVDYFPSFEIINSPAFKGVFFEPNLRNVNPYGVDFVMKNFFTCMVDKFGSDAGAPKDQNFKINRSFYDVSNAVVVDPACDEEILSAFGKRDV